MKTPKIFEPLIQDGLVDEVLRQLLSGQEAGQHSVCRSVDYTEGRKVKNSRRDRAMEKDSKYGSKVSGSLPFTSLLQQVCECTHHTVSRRRVLMARVTGDDGAATPKFNKVALTPGSACAYHGFLITQAACMLCAGLASIELSQYNVLVGSDYRRRQFVKPN